MTIAEYERRQLALTLVELAAQTGIDRRTLRRIESGHEPSRAVAHVLGSRLRVAPETLHRAHCSPFVTSAKELRAALR